MSRSTSQPEAQSGMVLYALIAMILPLVVMVGTISGTMNTRNAGLLREIHEEKALMAAESGLDEALFRASQGLLVSGSPFSRDMGDGLTYEVTPLNLRLDGIDNDGDASVDEVDEDVFQVTVVGLYGKARRRLAGYLGPLPNMPVPEAAMTFGSAPSDEIEVENDPDTALISGLDVNMDGSPGPGPDLPGASIMSPGTTADLDATLDLRNGGDIIGSTPSPSLGVATPIDLPALVQQLKNSANIVLTGDEYDGIDLGNGPAGIVNIVYRDGDLELENGSRGAGILVVTGELEIEEGSRWDGIVIVLSEEFEVEENSAVYGAVMLGSGLEEVEVEGENGGAALVQYSSEAIALAMTLAPPGKYVAFNGWQELSRN